MLLYVLICLSLSLTGVAGLQMMYMFYLENIDRERKKFMSELQREVKALRRDLADAAETIARQKLQIESLDCENAEEAWAEVIEEK